MCFKRGVDEGINQIDVKLSGLNWMMMKNKYKNFVSRYGGDPNLDWMNFKIRRRYIKLRKKGSPTNRRSKTCRITSPAKCPAYKTRFCGQPPAAKQGLVNGLHCPEFIYQFYIHKNQKFCCRSCFKLLVITL
jgi:hypothetical protein